jgi:hypothetical protein
MGKKARRTAGRAAADAYDANDDDDDDCHCEVDRFRVVTVNQPNVVTDAAGRTDVYGHARFVALFNDNGCCRCCEFRQYIRGYAELNGVSVAPPVPNFNILGWNEDQDAAGGKYGHRNRPAERGNRYVPNQANGCTYLGSDYPGFYGLNPGDDYLIYFEFSDFIIDTCNGDAVVSGPETWDFVAAGKAP